MRQMIMEHFIGQLNLFKEKKKEKLYLIQNAAKHPL